jgi:hypothetical protein
VPVQGARDDEQRSVGPTTLDAPDLPISHRVVLCRQPEQARVARNGQHVLVNVGRRTEAFDMAAKTQVTDEVQLDQAGTEVKGTTNGSGYVLPLVHTSINAALETEHGGHRVLISVDGTTVETPPIEHLIFYAGLAVLVGVELVELPVAVALGVGHALIDITRRPGLQAVGEVLEEA